MPASISCPACAKRLTAPDAAAGRSVRCPNCSHRFALPATVEQIEETPRPARSTARHAARPSRGTGSGATRAVVAVAVVALLVGGAGLWLVIGEKPPVPQPEGVADAGRVPEKGTAPEPKGAPATTPKTEPPARPKNVPPAKQSPELDAKAARLRRLDAEALAAFRSGQLTEGTTKLIEAVKPYQKLTPADCSPAEALAAAVVYARIASVAGRSLPEDTALTYTTAATEYAKRGGIPASDAQRWFTDILSETVAAYKPTKPPAGPALWVAAARDELAAAKRRPKQVEPVKPARMTPAEYDLLKDTAVDAFKTLYSVDNPAKLPEGEEAVMLLSINLDAVALMPESLRVVRREAFTRLAAHAQGDKQLLADLASAFPEAGKLHNDAAFRTAMQARLPWGERKKLYDRFTKATAQTEKWTLLVPFDDLNGTEMKAAVAAAESAKSNGLRTATAADRALLLRAGALDFFESLLPKP